MAPGGLETLPALRTERLVMFPGKHPGCLMTELNGPDLEMVLASTLLLRRALPIIRYYRHQFLSRTGAATPSGPATSISPETAPRTPSITSAQRNPRCAKRSKYCRVSVLVGQPFRLTFPNCHELDCLRGKIPQILRWRNGKCTRLSLCLRTFSYRNCRIGETP